MNHSKRGSQTLVCPICEQQQSSRASYCEVCGAHLAFLREHPRRVVKCVTASIALGLGLFVALAWQVFAPLLRGGPPAGPGPWFWWGFGLGAFFLSFGLTANSQLARVLSSNKGCRER